MTDRTQLIHFLASVSAASTGDLAGFQSIVAACPSLLESPRSPSSAFSVLLYFLPEAIPFKIYADLVHILVTGDVTKQGSLPDMESYELLSDDVLTQRAQKVSTYIASKTKPYGWTAEGPSYIEDWIKARVRLVDACTGLVSDSQPLFNTADTASSDLFTWQYGIVQVLVHFRSFYHTHTEWLTLERFEAMSPRTAVQLLLQFTSVDTVVRDINTLVVPFLTYKTAAEHDYSALWEWVGQTSSVNELDPPAHLALLLQLVEEGGISLPSDQAHFKFVRAVLAYAYTYPQQHYTSITYAQFADLQKYMGDFELDTDTPDYLIPDDVKETDLFLFDTLMTSNLTTPTLYSLSLFDKFKSAAALLASQIPNMTVIEVVVTSLFGSEQDQIALARKYIFGDHNDDIAWKSLDNAQWGKLRDNIRWLKTKSLVLAKVPDTWIEETLLVSTLSCARFDFVKTHYITVRKTALSTNVITKHLLDAFYENYDMATNCSAARGSLKNAAACLALLEEKHSKRQMPSAVSRASKLITATDALSIYSLTLTPGVPLHPVELRVQKKDPLSIIHRVLELNPKAYHDLTKLQTIATDLVYGIVGEALPHTDIKVRAMCIDAALVDSNFEQAYTYTDVLREQASAISTKQDVDEDLQQLIWTTCYQVGKFVSPDWDDTDSKQAAVLLEKQLELLSHTLAVAPRENLSSILSVWQRIESELAEVTVTSAASVETGPASTTASIGSGTVPEGRKRDALKSAGSRFARAIQSSATATFGGSSGSSRSNSREPAAAGITNVSGVEPGRTGHVGASEEMRKRDQLSGLLVSGLGWAIGANPR